MVLATAGGDGQPDARFVLVRGVDAAGFVFHTNYDSPKSRQVDANPRGAGVFAWLDLHRQVRVRGPMERVSRAESDAYFASRPRDSQIGAWASPQSEVLADRADLDRRIASDRSRVRRQGRSPARLLGWVAPRASTRWSSGRAARAGSTTASATAATAPADGSPSDSRRDDARSAALGEPDARDLAGRRVRQRGDGADVGGILERVEIGRLPRRRRWARRWRTGAGRGPARRVEHEHLDVGVEHERAHLGPHVAERARPPPPGERFLVEGAGVDRPDGRIGERVAVEADRAAGPRRGERGDRPGVEAGAVPVADRGGDRRARRGRRRRRSPGRRCAPTSTGCRPCRPRSAAVAACRRHRRRRPPARRPARAAPRLTAATTTSRPAPWRRSARPSAARTRRRSNRPIAARARGRAAAARSARRRAPGC